MRNKILFILHYPPPVHGAAMVGSFIKNSKVVNKNFDTKYIRLGTTKSFNERGKTTYKKVFRFIRLMWNSIYTVLTFQPNIVYMTITSSGWGFYKDALIVTLIKVAGVKLVYHFHNKGIKKRQHKSFDNWLYNKVFQRAEVILLSSHLYDEVDKYVPKERVHICPNGIPKMFQLNDEEQAPKDGKPTQILFLSNLIKSKGVFVLLKACKLLKEKGLNFECIYVGGEGDISSDELEQIISKMGLNSEVAYVGKKYDKEKEAIFSKSEIFAFPTYYPNECFPLVLLEAMQAKLPIVSTPEGGIAEIVKEGDNGFLVPQKNSKLLAEKLEELIKNPRKRKEMGEVGRKRYEKQFTVGHFEERMISILKEIADK